MSQARNSKVNPILLVMFVAAGLLGSMIWYLAHFSTWYSERTLVASHTLIAFFAMTASSFILSQHRIRQDSQQTVFHGTMLFIAVYNIILAGWLLFDENFLLMRGTSIVVLAEVTALTIFSVLVFLSVILHQRGISERRSAIVFLMIAIGLFVQATVYFVLLPIIPENWYLAISIGLCVIVVIILVLSAILWSRPVEPYRNYDVTYIVSGLVTFSLSGIPNTMSLVYEGSIWAIGFTLQICGLLLILLGTAIPFLTRVGMPWKSAYAMTLGLSSLAFIPGLFLIINGFFSTGYNFRNIELYIVIHFGASILALIMAILLLKFNSKKQQPNRVPIIAAFVTWSVIEVFQFAGMLILGEPFGSRDIPLLIGSLITLILLVYAIRWTITPPTSSFPEIIRRMIYGIVPVVLGLTLVTLIIEEIIDTWLGHPDLPLGEFLLLIAVLMVTYTYVYLSAVLLNKSKGRTSVEVLSIAFLSLWIIPLFAKSIFDSWTIGWWSSEILLFCGLIIGPAVLGLMYLSQMEKSEDSQILATLYADILAHDISNYHQSITLCLGLLQMDGLRESVKTNAIEDASMQLQRADQLIKNVRRLGIAREASNISFIPTDIVETARSAFYVASRVSDTDEFDFSINKESGECLTPANELLVDVFINLFDNAIKYSVNEKKIKVEIKEITRRNKPCWNIQVIDYGKGIEPDRVSKLFTRYMEEATGSGLGLSVVKTLVEMYGGSVAVSERISGDFSLGTIFEIVLPKV